MIDSEEHLKIVRKFGEFEAGRVSLYELTDEELLGFRQFSVTRLSGTENSKLRADLIAEELAYRRNLKDQAARDRSSKSMESLTKALVFVGIIQALVTTFDFAYKITHN